MKYAGIGLLLVSAGVFLAAFLAFEVAVMLAFDRMPVVQTVFFAAVWLVVAGRLWRSLFFHSSDLPLIGMHTNVRTDACRELLLLALLYATLNGLLVGAAWFDGRATFAGIARWLATALGRLAASGGAAIAAAWCFGRWLDK